jgi:hypothetical protein
VRRANALSQLGNVDPELGSAASGAYLIARLAKGATGRADNFPPPGDEMSIKDLADMILNQKKQSVRPLSVEDGADDFEMVEGDGLRRRKGKGLKRGRKKGRR